MSIFTEITNPIKEVGKILDELFTSKDEQLSKEIIMMRLDNCIKEKQIEINKQEAKSKSLFIAGWRPFIGWTCAFGILYEFLFNPFLTGFGYNFPSIEISALHSLIMGMLGLGGLRTFEKVKKVQ